MPVMSAAPNSSSGPARRVARGNAAGAVRVRVKLDAALADGNFYEAHQMYRTLYHRLQAQGKYVELEILLYEGSLTLFGGGEIGGGVDLAKLFVQVLSSGELVGKEERFQKVAKLYSLIPTKSPEKDAIMASAIRWSSQGNNRFGHPRLHQIVAYNMWSFQRFPESRHHFLHSSDGVGCGSMLADFQQKRGYPREVDIFIVSTVLQLICLKKHIVAAIALRSYTERHPSIKRGPPYIHPLLNFVWFLLLAIEHKKSLTAFSVLIEKYKSALSRDPQFLEYLDKIGQCFFNLPAPQRQASGGGMFSGLFDSFLDVLNNDDDDDVMTRPRRIESKMELD